MNLPYYLPYFFILRLINKNIYIIDDIIAHEWLHGYTSYTTDYIYAYQPGALNEAISDIFGEGERTTRCDVVCYNKHSIMPYC